MERYLCIHGHFYQPPRENPWLEFVEVQDSAYPYHDWNERILRECYGPNGLARIVDEHGRIARLVNNYARMSFNFGPTLLSWLEDHAPKAYERILEADRESGRRFGRGSAIAQPYNHMIMPLASRRDKYTQARWGIRDFERRFGRSPEGMWLPETAVDRETLDVLAELGVRFTILAPHQALRVRPLDGKTWEDVGAGRVDPTRPYLVRLPTGRSIAVFFYDGPLSRAVAFERVLDRGDEFVRRIGSAFLGSRAWPQIVSVAADGETYGHHHRGGDAALAYALERAEADGIARLTNYAAYLKEHPPAYEVEVVDRTSWSCAHGIERWRGDCGCHTGGGPGWNQAWRKPLREAFDWLRDVLTAEYERAAGELLVDPWIARDDYVRVVLDRTEDSVDAFLREHASRPVDDETRVGMLRLLEMQRHLMLMYTSCGWFFNDLSGIETTQVLQYAGRAIQLAEQLFGQPFERRFLKRLADAKSNRPERGDGREIYETTVREAKVDLEEAVAHYAVRSLFNGPPERHEMYTYRIDPKANESAEVDGAKLLVGRATVTSKITHDSGLITYGALRVGDHRIHAAGRRSQGEAPDREVTARLSDAFRRSDFGEVVRLIEGHFGPLTYSLHSLAREERHRVVATILDAALGSYEGGFSESQRRIAPMLGDLRKTDVPLFRNFRATAEVVANAVLRKAIRQEEPDVGMIRELFEEAESLQVPLDRAGLGSRGTSGWSRR